MRYLGKPVAEFDPRIVERGRQALQRLAGLREQVDAFFDRVLVNTDEDDVRNNRLGLLTRLNKLMNQVADISRLAV